MRHKDVEVAAKTRQQGSLVKGVSAMGKKCAKQTRRKSFMFKNHVIYTTAKHCDKAKLRVFFKLKERPGDRKIIKGSWNF